jgi:ribosomal protein S18 acetylase RimI-like enzyme
MALAETRTATGADVDEIVRIQHATWQAAYAELVPADAIEQLRSPGARQAWVSAIASGQGAVLVATEGQWTVGFCIAAPATLEEPQAPSGRVQIMALLVEPRWGRRGHGRRLVGETFAALSAGGATEGVAWVPEQDVVSRAFYDRIGWDPDGYVRTLDTGEGQLREIRLAGPLQVRNRNPRTRELDPEH